MQRLDAQAAIAAGAPESKVKTPDNKEGFVYWAKTADPDTKQ